MPSARSFLAAAALVAATASWADDTLRAPSDTLPAPSDALRVPRDYPTIQAAIDAAAPGATVVVASGTYFENLSIGKTVTLTAESGPATTTLDGGHLGRVIFARGTGSEWVDIVGFTITNGLNLESMDVPSAGVGSGVYLESLAGATLRDNVIRDNVGCLGVGVSTLDVTVAVVHNQILRNVQDASCVAVDGGGILVRRGGSGPSLIASNTISGNVAAGDGAGVKVESATAVIRGNDIRGNSASSGGGIAFDLSDGIVSDNLLVGNSAEVGGALRVVPIDDHQVLVADNTLLDNRATMSASAVHLIAVPGEALRLRGNTISGDGVVELIRCDTPFAVSRSNVLRNAEGPAVAGLCTFGFVF